MFRIRMLLLSAALASGASLAADAPRAPPAPAAKSVNCFRPEQFQSWKAPNAATIYIRVSLNHYYRLDLAGKCPEILQPDSHLDTRFDGTNMVCGALDWNIKVATPFGMGQSCIVKAMTELSPEEVKAIPKEFKP